jgi:5-methylthioadenosine/S-adenosylhomocysteine deaminase
MQGEGVGYMADGAVAVRGGLIVAVGSTTELESRFRADVKMDASNCAVLPGLIDAHIHAGCVVRGVA